MQLEYQHHLIDPTNIEPVALLERRRRRSGGNALTVDIDTVHAVQIDDGVPRDHRIKLHAGVKTRDPVVEN